MIYLDVLFVIAFITFGIRCQYTYCKFASYCKERYPEIYSDLRSLGTISQKKVVFMEHPDINDPEFSHLKGNAKNAYKTVRLIFFGGILIIIIASFLGLK